MRKRNRKYSPNWGGRRAGAGRPSTGRTTVEHGPRPEFTRRHPLLLSLRTKAGIPSLRRPACLEAVQTAIEGGQRPDFRVVHFVVLPRQLRFVVEANGADPLAKGMQAMTVRIARALNRVLDREGSLFAERYAMQPLTTGAEVRQALVTVLCSGKERGINRYSSGPWFDAWAKKPSAPEAWLKKLQGQPAPTVAPQTALLKDDWRRLGLLGFNETTG